MAEKEERIYIKKLGPNPSDCFLIDNTCDGMCVRCTQGMTRREAISCMADAISDAAKRSCNKKFVAEAALNALLEK